MHNTDTRLLNGRRNTIEWSTAVAHSTFDHCLIVAIRYLNTRDNRHPCTTLPDFPTARSNWNKFYHLRLSWSLSCCLEASRANLRRSSRSSRRPTRTGWRCSAGSGRSDCSDCWPRDRCSCSGGSAGRSGPAGDCCSERSPSHCCSSRCRTFWHSSGCVLLRWWWGDELADDELYGNDRRWSTKRTCTRRVAEESFGWEVRVVGAEWAGCVVSSRITAGHTVCSIGSVKGERTTIEFSNRPKTVCFDFKICNWRCLWTSVSLSNRKSGNDGAKEAHASAHLA